MAMRILTTTLATFLLMIISGCGQSDIPVGLDVSRYNPELDKNCRDCDLNGANLEGANLAGANLEHAVLGGANLTWANLTDYNLLLSIPIAAS